MTENEKNAIQELHAYIRGVVQGVGFRYFVIQRANQLRLHGYVRNRSDGSVEVLAQGPKDALERLKAMLRQGPSGASVDEVQAQWREPSEHFRGFHIRW